MGRQKTGLNYSCSSATCNAKGSVSARRRLALGCYRFRCVYRVGICESYLRFRYCTSGLRPPL